jgi:hypothetical protein
MELGAVKRHCEDFLSLGRKVSPSYCRDETVCEAWIELDPTATNDLIDGIFGRESGAIGAGRCHGVIGIGQGDDRSEKRYLLTP